MRKLRKSFAVLLALVMMLTVMVPLAAGANGITTVASFADADDVSPANLMALDVLAAVGVLRGEDGNIYPQRTITRAEAATIVARTLLGPASADTLPPGRTGFRDVDNVSGLAFASGAIAYLHERGIVIGVGDDLFDPQSPVTGAELATMFLRAVGFGVNGEYTGPRWQTNAVVDGMQWRILSGDADFTAPATREQVFRYAFNAMNTNRSIVGLRFVNWSADRQAYVPILLQGIDAGDAQNLQTIHSRIFEPAPINLRRLGADDIFGRPGTRFTLRGIEIGMYPDAADVTFTAHTSTGSVRDAIDQFVIPATVNGIVNGSETLPGAGPISRADVGSRISGMTGNGILVELFVNSNTNELHTVTAIRTDIAEVTRINAGRTEFQISVISSDSSFAANDGAAVRTAAFGAAEVLTIDNLSAVFGDVSELNLGDAVLVSPAFHNEVWIAGAVTTPEVVSGRLQSSSGFVNLGGNTGSLTVEGVVHRRARILTASAGAATMAQANMEVTLLLDEYGFIVDTTTAGVSTRQLAFVRATGNGLSGVLLRPLLRVTYPDGTEADVLLTSNPTIMPQIGDIVAITGSGNNVNWAPAFTTNPAVQGTVGTAVATIPATMSSLHATVASLHANTQTIAPNQSTLNVGGRNLRFADDARYFHWDADNNRFSIRDRGDRVGSTTDPIVVAANRGNRVVAAVVEYRVIGQAPVISALWIGIEAAPTIQAQNLIFIQGGGSQHTVIIDGDSYRTLRGFGVDGRPIVWNAPENWPNAEWVAIRDDAAGNTATGWYTFTIDSNNRFELTQVDNDEYENLGVFTRIVATTNGLTASLVPFLAAGDDGTGVTLGSITMGAQTFIRDVGTVAAQRPAGSVEDRGALRDFIVWASANNLLVEISVVYDARNANLASAIFVHGVR